MKQILFALSILIYFSGYSQYIGVRAKYTDTRLVDDAPNPPKRENRLILSFFEVSASGQYIPVNLSNYDLWVYKGGLQYGNGTGGVLDSTGNNYPGYSYPAPRAVAYYNTYGINYIDCDPNAATHYIVNGHQLDCGFINVSYWDIDYGTGNPFEAFTAPNICLPFYNLPHPYYFTPGNVNFGSYFLSGPPYNLYNFACPGSTLQLVLRGLLEQDTSNTLVVLPVKFDNIRGILNGADNVQLSWSNMTESNIVHYEVERSADGVSFQTIGTVLPTLNNGSRADYTFLSIQPDQKDYYRVKAIETSGGLFYSSIIHLKKPNAPTELSIFPNPVTNGSLHFRLTNAETGRYILYLLNTASQQVKQKLINHSGGHMVRQIDLTGLPRGIYQVVIQSDSARFSKNIIYAY
jgi:hypothetical protein